MNLKLWSLIILVFALLHSSSLNSQTFSLGCKTLTDANSGINGAGIGVDRKIFPFPHSDGYYNDFQIPSNTFGDCAKVVSVNIDVTIFGFTDNSDDGTGTGTDCTGDWYTNMYLGCGVYAGEGTCPSTFLLGEDFTSSGPIDDDYTYDCFDFSGSASDAFNQVLSVDLVPVGNNPTCYMLVSDGDVTIDYEICAEYTVEILDCSSIGSGGCTEPDTYTLPCDDLDPTTCNDIETFLVCDDTSCGCVGTPNPICDDGDCTTDDIIDPITCDCTHVSNPPDCDDGDCATDDSYDLTTCDCINTFNPPDCDDGDCATDDSYDLATCACINTFNPPDCDDGDCATDDSYDLATCACINTPNPPDCDDGDCATDDSYDLATCACINTPNPPDCDDGDCATDDSYDLATCACINTPNPPDCDDGDCATDDSYDLATCACINTFNPPNCDDGDCATDDSYDLATCACINTFNPPNCDDGDCATDDSYDLATCACINTFNPPDCDDGDCATDDSYDLATCACINTPNPPDCDDGDCATDDDYNSLTCDCINVFNPPDCNDGDCATDDDYNSVTCDCINVFNPPDCDDGDCATDDSYDLATCACINTFNPPDCDDGDCSTDDSYDLATCDCINTPNIPICDDGDCNNGFEVFNPTTCDCDNIPAVFGCTNSTADNYNSLATCDDGSCSFICPDPGDCDDGICTNGIETWDGVNCICMTNAPTEIIGCTDSNFCEYNPLATCDDGSCITSNADPGTCDDGDCTNGIETWDSVSCNCVSNSVTEITGCTDASFCEYDPLATCDDGSCITSNADPGNCDDGDCNNGIETWDSVSCNCISNQVTEITGCTDSNFCEYDPLATCDDGSCITSNADPGTCNTDCTLGDIEEWDPNSCNCIVIEVSIFGCTNPTADNYNPSATCDDNSCIFSCPDPGTCDDGNCANGIETWDGVNCECVTNPTTEILGCTDPNFCEYDPLATCDDGSCVTSNADPNTCNTDCLLGDLEEWNSISCTCEVTTISVVGCTDPTATNFNPAANCEDNSCMFTAVVLGCTDPDYCEYDPNATVDDGSCVTLTTDPGTCNTDCLNGDIEDWDPIQCMCVVIEIPVLGCTNATADNYNSSATCDDGSCEFSCPDPGNCDDGDCTNGVETWDGINCECVMNPVLETLGCTDSNYCEYDPNATCDDGTCVTLNTDPGSCNTDCLAGNIESWNPVTCECEVISTPVVGCTNPSSCNYNPLADCEDGTCITFDCCDTLLNIGDVCDDGDANTENDTVQADCTCSGDSIFDCPAFMLNIGDPCDDGDSDTVDDVIQVDCSCSGEPVPCLEVEECNEDCTQGDIEEFNAVLCICEIIEVSVVGCTDPEADNYNPNANCDDGTCIVTPEVFLPNIISSTADFPNNVVIAPANSEVTNLAYSVYDRWGNKVAETTVADLTIEQVLWDGRCNGDNCEQGVYVFVIEYDKSGVPTRRIGDITLIR